MKRSIISAISIALISLSANASNIVNLNPAGYPGVIPNWSVAKKVQVGTSNTGTKSLVWFTNATGILTETYFPTIDAAQLKDSQILVTDGKTFLLQEREDTLHEVEAVSASLVKLVNKDKEHRFSISHTYYTMADKSVLVDEIEINAHVDGLSFYLLANPALNNTGFNDTGYVNKDHLTFFEDNTELSIRSTIPMTDMSIGFVGYTDGYQDLKDNFLLDNKFGYANNGNIAGIAKFKISPKTGTTKFYITYNFEKDDVIYSPKQLAFEKKQYNKGWDKYLDNIKTPANLNKVHADLYARSLYTLRIHEDKLTPGALIASLSKPWGDEMFEHPGVFNGGYHLVWPRDLYHVCTAFVQAGDLDAPRRALQFLKSVQYQSGYWNFNGRTIPRKGAFPQNVWTDGNEYWGGLQLDQTAYPIHIFYQLWTRANAIEKEKLLADFGDMMKQALEFVNTFGPWSAQERWEENFGISPSTFSAAASALILGDKIFSNTNYAQTADSWLNKPGDNIHTWTFTNKGHFQDGQYYIRVAGCSHHTATWNPNDGSTCTVSNSGERVEQTKLLDQGFLKLALLGLVPASDWRIKHSKDVVDKTIRVKTPNGYGWYRYSHDAYGEAKRGRLWPLLSGEHGRFAIERYRVNDLSWDEAEKEVNTVLESYTKFANKGNMIPEQVWEHTGEGTGGATPLAWSHAEYVKLLWSKAKKKNVENLLE